MQPQQQQQSSSEEGSKENTILNRLRHQKERNAQDHPSGPADSMPQGPAPTALTQTSQTGGQPQAPLVNNQNRDHQDPLEHNGTTNGSTRAPADNKGPGAAKGRSKTSEPHPGASSGTGSATQHAESSKNTIVCSACGKSGHWSINCPYYNFLTFVGLLRMELDHQSVYTVVKLTIAQLIVGTDQETTERSLEIHQMH